MNLSNSISYNAVKGCFSTFRCQYAVIRDHLMLTRLVGDLESGGSSFSPNLPVKMSQNFRLNLGTKVKILRLMSTNILSQRPPCLCPFTKSADQH